MYMIITGRVDIYVPNPEIKNFLQKYKFMKSNKNNLASILVDYKNRFGSRSVIGGLDQIPKTPDELARISPYIIKELVRHIAIQFHMLSKAYIQLQLVVEQFL